MRVTLEVDGKPTVVEVDVAGRTVRVGDRTFPVQVVADTPARVELEIGGEKVVVEGWRPGEPTPIEPIAIDGERFRVTASVDADASSSTPARRPSSSPALRPEPVTAGPGPVGGEGTPIAPPMPGKVVEVRVREGESVTAGQVLLVLEAMKMRNEVTAPIAGVVRALRVSAGTNVRAREPMLRVVPS